MTRKYFGTDGIRGRVGQAPMTVDFIMKLGTWARKTMPRSVASTMCGNTASFQFRAIVRQRDRVAGARKSPERRWDARGASTR